MENMSIQPVMTRSGSATSMSIADSLAPSVTNRLTPAERKAFGKSDHKAARILGITLTRNHVNQNGRLAQVPSGNQEDRQVGDTLAEMMTFIGAKRARGHNSSAVAVFRPRRGLGLASGMGMMDLVEKNKKHGVAGEYTQRVVLAPLCSNEPLVEKGEELPTTISDNGSCSFLEPGEIEETETPLASKYITGNNEEEDLFHGSRGFVWDVQNPFATPPNTVLQQYAEVMRLGETIGPLDVPPVASLCYTTNFDPSPEEETPALQLYSDDSFDDMLRPAERAYLDFLIAQDEAEEQPMESRRRRRAVVRSKNKMLDVLGVEARQAVITGQCL